MYTEWTKEKTQVIILLSRGHQCHIKWPYHWPALSWVAAWRSDDSFIRWPDTSFMQPERKEEKKRREREKKGTKVAASTRETLSLTVAINEWMMLKSFLFGRSKLTNCPQLQHPSKESVWKRNRMKAWGKKKKKKRKKMHAAVESRGKLAWRVTTNRHTHTFTQSVSQSQTHWYTGTRSKGCTMY